MLLLWTPGIDSNEIDSLWEIYSVVELIPRARISYKDFRTVAIIFCLSSCLIQVNCVASIPLSVNTQTNSCLQGMKSRFLLLKLTFYGTWPTRFHTWFLLNSRNWLSPHIPSKNTWVRICKHVRSTVIYSLESIPGLRKSLKILSQLCNLCRISPGQSEFTTYILHCTIHYVVKEMSVFSNRDGFSIQLL